MFSYYSQLSCGKIGRAARERVPRLYFDRRHDIVVLQFAGKEPAWGTEGSFHGRQTMAPCTGRRQAGHLQQKLAAGRRQAIVSCRAPVSQPPEAKTCCREEARPVGGIDVYKWRLLERSHQRKGLTARFVE